MEKAENALKKFELCTEPLDPKQHPEEIVNIVSGNVVNASVNVKNAAAIRTKQMQDYENTLPSGLYSTIKKTELTMKAAKKTNHIEDIRVMDTNLTYSSVIGLQASSRDIDINDVLSRELSSVPTSMFTDDGEMRIAKCKSFLKKQL